MNNKTINKQTTYRKKPKASAVSEHHRWPSSNYYDIMTQWKRQKNMNRSFSSHDFQAILAISGHICKDYTYLTEMDLGKSSFYQSIW